MERRNMNERLLEALVVAQERLNMLIDLTPSGEFRNKLTDENIIILTLIDECKNNKTSDIKLTNLKDSDGWHEMAQTLLFDKFEAEHKDLDEDELHEKFYEEVIEKYFEYGEYANIEIKVDEYMNIVGGRIIPQKE